MTFDSHQRALLASLADVLIPASEGFPSASEAGVAGQALDQVLVSRPDLAVGLKKLLAQAGTRPAAEFVAQLRASDPMSFGILAELIPGAYFLNPHVRSKLGYHGQGPRPIDPDAEQVEESLLRAVTDRGPIYRPTPGNTTPASPPAGHG